MKWLSGLSAPLKHPFTLFEAQTQDIGLHTESDTHAVKQCVTIFFFHVY